MYEVYLLQAEKRLRKEVTVRSLIQEIALLEFAAETL
jgi:hypothetical protein